LEGWRVEVAEVDWKAGDLEVVNWEWDLAVPELERVSFE